jgi:ubiquinone/menaquinone biosynthesis C-methylase UbiE
MAETQIRFDDGAAYERMMGNWSRRAGEIFLDWLAPSPGLRWVDVGCGNGAFTELLVARCSPAEVHGIDPSEGQLAYARTRPGVANARFGQGHAMALPFPDNRFDAATMALVIFFVPDPAKGVAELARVFCPGGTAAAYACDMFGGGFPLEPILAEIRALGLPPVMPPSPEASRIEVMRDLWKAAGFDQVETREIAVQRSFADFEEYWTIAATGAAGLSSALAMMAPADVERIKTRTRTNLNPDASGKITCSARANAVKGRLPK